MNSFIFPAYTGLGNFIMMTPAILKIRSEFPKSKIFILAGNSFGTEQVFKESDQIIDRVFIINENSSYFKKIIFFIKLRKYKISTAFVPFNASPSFYRWGIVVAGIPHRIGHTFEVLNKEMSWTKKTLTNKIPLRLNSHESDLHLDLIESIRGKFNRDYETHVSDDSESVLKIFNLGKKGYCIIQVLAANAEKNPKLWPLEKFAELIKILCSNRITVVLAGDKREETLIADFIKKYKLQVYNLAGKTTVNQVSSLIKHSSFLICHDSGLMHIGNAHKTPLIALYGPTDYIYTMPKSETSHIVRKELSCSPCMKNFALTEMEALEKCQFNVECMRTIEVLDVINVINKLVGIKIDKTG